MRSLQSPRMARRMLTFVASPPMSGFAISGRLAVHHWCNEVESSSLALGLTTSPSGRNHLPSPDRIRPDRNVSRALLPPHAEAQLHAERTISMYSTFQLYRTHRHSRHNRSRGGTERRSLYDRRPTESFSSVPTTTRNDSAARRSFNDCQLGRKNEGMILPERLSMNFWSAAEVYEKQLACTIASAAERKYIDLLFFSSPCLWLCRLCRCVLYS